MSCNWSEHGFGLVFNSEEADAFAKEVSACLDPDLDPEDMSVWLVPETLEKELPDTCIRYYDDEMDGKTFHSWDGECDMEPDGMLVFWAEKAPDAFKAAYTGIDEAVAEFREKIGKYLPGNFNYPAHIGYFSCCVYC